MSPGACSLRCWCLRRCCGRGCGGSRVGCRMLAIVLVEDVSRFDPVNRQVTSLPFMRSVMVLLDLDIMR
jgi:hypothetical protein